MSLYPVIAYIRHLFLSGNSAGHGVHSPFVYDFLTTVIRNKTDNSIVRDSEAIRSGMKRLREVIEVTDLGAGSLKSSGTKRSISEIAFTTSLPSRQLALLARLVQGWMARELPDEPGDQEGSMRGIILELGTSLGISACTLARAAGHREVVTVEGCPALAARARMNLETYGCAGVMVLNMEFSDALLMMEEDGTRVSFAFIDGNHRGEAMTGYVRKIFAMNDEMMIVADDIHLTADMYRAWKRLVHSGLYPVTIETSRFGIIIRKRSITPGHYRIRC